MHIFSQIEKLKVQFHDTATSINTQFQPKELIFTFWNRIEWDNKVQFTELLKNLYSFEEIMWGENFFFEVLLELVFRKITFRSKFAQ